jgi:hypothetical protein
VKELFDERTAKINPESIVHPTTDKWTVMSCDASRCDADYLMPAGLENHDPQLCWNHLPHAARSARLLLIWAALSVLGDPYARSTVRTAVEPWS